MRSLGLVWAQVVYYALAFPVSFLVVRFAAPRELSLIVASQAIASFTVVFTNANFDYENIPRITSSDSFGQDVSIGIRSKAFAIWAIMTIIFCPILLSMAKDIRELSIVLLCYLGSFGAVLLQNSLIFQFSMQTHVLLVTTISRVAFLCILWPFHGYHHFALVYSVLVASFSILPGIYLCVLESMHRKILCPVGKSRVDFSVFWRAFAANGGQSFTLRSLKSKFKGLLGRLLSINVVWQLVLISPGVMLPLAIESQAGFSQLVLFDRIARPVYQVSNISAYTLFKRKGFSELKRLILSRNSIINRVLGLVVLALAVFASCNALYVLACYLVPGYAAINSNISTSFLLLFCSLLFITLASFCVNYDFLGSGSQALQSKQHRGLICLASLACFGLYIWAIVNLAPHRIGSFVSAYLLFCSSLPILSLLLRKVPCLRWLT